MNIFRAFNRDQKPEGAGPNTARALLPELNAFVEVAIGAETKRHSVPIDAIGANTFSTRMLPGLSVGVAADFLYTNTAGRFRFATVCAALDKQQAHFKIPADVRTLADYSAKRSAVRLDSLLPVQWRYAPGGKGNGEFVKASMCDLSRGGASLVVGRELRAGTQVEVTFTLKNADTTPLTVIGEVMRAAKIETSGKNSAGIRFLNVDSAAERVINAYINESQALRRDRGVV